MCRWLQYLKHMTCDTHMSSIPHVCLELWTLEDLPKAKKYISKPLYQIHMDSFSSSVKSIERYFHALVLADAGIEYRWIWIEDQKRCAQCSVEMVRRNFRLAGQT